MVAVACPECAHWRQVMWPNKFRGTEVVLKDFPANLFKELGGLTQCYVEQLTMKVAPPTAKHRAIPPSSTSELMVRIGAECRKNRVRIGAPT